MARAIWLLGVAALVLLPLIWCLTFGADFIALANESVAYRFFYSIRIHAGPDLTAWLPQGQLVTSIQHLIVWLLPDLTAESLRSSLNVFSLWSIGTIAAISVGALCLAATSKNWLDRATLSIVALVPLYVFPGTLMLWPDYLALNVALAVLCVALFQWEWHRDEGSSIRCALYGVLAGSIAANKISMIVLTAPLVVLAATHGARLKVALTRIGIAAVGTVLAFGFWWLAAGLFRVDWLIAVLPKWWQFVTNPGGEPGFAAWSYLWGVYGLAVLWFVLALVIAAVGRLRDRAALAPGTTALIAATLCIVAIWRRPAGTTLADTALVLLALGAMLFTFAKRSIASDAVIAAAALAFAAAAISSGQPRIMYAVIAGSRPAGDEQWRFFDRVKQNAAGHEVIYFVPNNHYQHGDVFIFLLKGVSDFGTWNVGRGGEALLRRLGVNVAFVSGHPIPVRSEPALSDGKVLVWINAARLRNVEDHYPLLTEAAARPGSNHDVISLPHAAATGHIVLLRSAQAPQ
jgi:hypothetical protein